MEKFIPKRAQLYYALWGVGVFFGVKNSKTKQKGDTMRNGIKRDMAVQANYRREISLQTRVVRDRTKYTRKVKHKIRYA